MTRRVNKQIMAGIDSKRTFYYCQLDVPVGQGVGWSQLRWTDFGVRRWRLCATASTDAQRGTGSDPVPQGRPILPLGTLSMCPVSTLT